MQELQAVAAEFIRAVLTGAEDPILRDLEIQVRLNPVEGLRRMSETTVEPLHYSTAEAYHRHALVFGLLRKCDNLPWKADTALVALEKHFECERFNHLTNYRLKGIANHLAFREDVDDEVYRLRKFWGRLRYNVRRILGPLPDLSRSGKFTNGATYENKGLIGKQIQSKLSNDPEVTTEGVLETIAFEETAWNKHIQGLLFASGPPQICQYNRVRGERFDTVPKDTKTDRPIGVQPSGNLFAQKAIGGAIRKRLNGFGLLQAYPTPPCPLEDLQQRGLFPGRKRLRKPGPVKESSEQRHIRHARESSVDGKLATIDLSSASDLISYMFVKLALPEDWFAALDKTRCKFLRINDKWHRLERFSSMGNGFTFELETCLFYALMLTVVPKERHDEISVFGDDIIIPSEYFLIACSALKYCGFKVNPKKSFGTGPFRESCGGDFFGGKAVRPVFLRDVPREPHQWVIFHNQLATLRDVIPIESVLNLVKGFLPRQVRKCRGPASLGDSVLHEDDPDKWERRVRELPRLVLQGTNDGCPVSWLFAPVRLWEQYRLVLQYQTYTRKRWCDTSNVASALHRPLPEEVADPEVRGYKCSWVPV